MLTNVLDEVRDDADHGQCQTDCQHGYQLVAYERSSMTLHEFWAIPVRHEVHFLQGLVHTIVGLDLYGACRATDMDTAQSASTDRGNAL